VVSALWAGLILDFLDDGTTSFRQAACGRLDQSRSCRSQNGMEHWFFSRSALPVQRRWVLSGPVMKHFDSYPAAASYARSMPGACIRRCESGGFDVAGGSPKVEQPPKLVPCRYCSTPIPDEQFRIGVRVCSQCADRSKPEPRSGSRSADQPAAATCQNCSRTIDHSRLKAGIRLCRECASRQAEAKNPPGSEKCPRCGSVLVIRVGTIDGPSVPYLSCSNRKCRYTAA
jgi:hypothetical protein